MKKYKYVTSIFFLISIFSACVPAKKLEDAVTLNSSLAAENNNLHNQLANSQDEGKALTSRIDELTDQVNKLASDTTFIGERYRKASALNSQVNNLYEQSIEQNESLLSKSSTERLALGDSLKRKQQDIYQKGKALDSLQRNLMEREGKLAELQSLLKQKDSAANALKSQLTNALLGFETSDLTVEQRNGKVYVSMAEKLLFKSGSTTVDTKGVDALKKLAAVLRSNSDLTINVEGHTDNVPLTGKGAIKDNWDLSVLRATSIIRILADNGVVPKQIIASGRGEYFPVSANSSSEGKAKNRRTEIVLSPRLEELMKVIGVD